MLPPLQKRHKGEDKAALAKRKEVYEEARKYNPLIDWSKVKQEIGLIYLSNGTGRNLNKL